MRRGWRCPGVKHPGQGIIRNRHPAHKARPHGSESLEAVPRDDDFRPPDRRSGRRFGPGSGRRGRRHLHRHRRRLSARRRLRPCRHDRGHPRTLAQGQAPPVRARHQVLRAYRPPGLGRGQQPPSHPRRRRRLAAKARNRLHRPLPASRRRPRDPARGNSASPGRPRPIRQGSLHRVFELSRLPRGPRARPQRGAGARALRHRAASLQPFVPRVRTRALSALSRRRHRRHPLQPARRRAAVGQARAGPRAGRGHALHHP